MFGRVYNDKNILYKHRVKTMYNTYEESVMKPKMQNHSRFQSRYPWPFKSQLYIPSSLSIFTQGEEWAISKGSFIKSCSRY